MDLITFESSAYKELVQKIERIAEYVAKKENNPKEKEEIWMDSLELADLLHISTRTLQRLRKENQISYTKLRGRCLYRLSDIEKGLSEKIIKANPKTLEDFRKNYLLKGKRFVL